MPASRAPQICTQCAHSQRSIPATRRSYSASPHAMPVETSVTTPPVDPSLVPELKTDHPTSLYSLKAGIILSRPPLLTRKQTPFEKAFYLYQKRLNERVSTPFARSFYYKPGQPATIDFSIKWAERGHTMAREIGRMVRSGKWAWDDELLVGKGDELAEPDRVREALYTDAESRVSEDGEALTFEDRIRIERPLPRETEADRTGDVRRLDRALDRTLYLVVKKKRTGVWRFPQARVHPEEGLHEAAARALTGSAGINMNTWMVGRVPIAYEHREPVYKDGANGEKEIKTYGADVFYLKGRIMAGQVDLTDNQWGIDDFKWLTREELEKQIGGQTFRSVKNSMSLR
ncbi:54S ribosomal protein L17, mitochondrial [Cytospora mali]|uniref:Large ribosomal subunit protein mL46 n=1 Tax=Cytospora mali TaxID=578113 RepID=A0A194V7P5_CYTMA|nr:54S ribosomal protein L17, mitochondrial [Valsa mali var. pyri (nom. inval.)]